MKRLRNITIALMAIMFVVNPMAGCDFEVNISTSGEDSATGDDPPPAESSDSTANGADGSTGDITTSNTGADETGTPEDTEGPGCSLLTLGTLPCEEDGLFWSESPLCHSAPYGNGTVDGRAPERLPSMVPSGTVYRNPNWNFEDFEDISGYALLMEDHNDVLSYWSYNPDEVPFIVGSSDELWFWTVVSAPSLSEDEVAAYYINVGGLGDTVFSIDSEVVPLGCGLFVAKAMFPIPEVGYFLDVHWNMPQNVVIYVWHDPTNSALPAQMEVDGSGVSDTDHLAYLSGGGVIKAYP